MTDDDKLDQRFCALAERIRVTAAPPSPGPVKVYIAWPGKPTIALVGNPAEMYADLLQSLFAKFAPDEVGTVSRAEVEVRLDRALQDALGPGGQGQGERSKSFGEAVRREAEKLRGALMAPPVRWKVHVPLHAPRVSVPVRFGHVEFLPHESEAVRQLKDKVPEIATAFDVETIARISVLAVDGAAAKIRGQATLRHTIDVLDFVSPVVDAPYLEPRAAFESVEAPGESAIVAVGATHSDYTTIGFYVRVRKLESQDKQPPLEAALNRLLAEADQGPLRSRISTALGWAGRANVQRRRDQAFLMKMISLESALTSSETRSGTTERLKVRVVHVLGGTLEERRMAYERIGTFYQIRSGIVHAGAATQVSDDIMDEFNLLVRRVFERLLLVPVFSSMRTEAELERWFEEQQLAGNGAPRVSPGDR